MAPLSSLARPAFAHCSDTANLVNQALNFFAHHNNFTRFPEGMKCIASNPIKIANKQATAGDWAMIYPLLFMFGLIVVLSIFVLIVLNCHYNYLDSSDSDRDLEQKERAGERTPLLAQEEKSF
ncbi:hypothetical protein EAE96_004123 [Botrytis aclada]|nr:hypothetical protein EAE96_004123 [Botrytis aclada]